MRFVGHILAMALAASLCGCGAQRKYCGTAPHTQGDTVVFRFYDPGSATLFAAQSPDSLVPASEIRKLFRIDDMKLYSRCSDVADFTVSYVDSARLVYSTFVGNTIRYTEELRKDLRRTVHYNKYGNIRRIEYTNFSNLGGYFMSPGQSFFIGTGNYREMTVLPRQPERYLQSCGEDGPPIDVSAFHAEVVTNPEDGSEYTDRFGYERVVGSIEDNFKLGEWIYYRDNGEIERVVNYRLKDKVDVRFPFCHFNARRFRNE